MFSKPISKTKAANIAQYKITEILDKQKNPYEDGNAIKECVLVAGESLLIEIKNTTKIFSAMKEVELS